MRNKAYQGNSLLEESMRLWNRNDGAAPPPEKTTNEFKEGRRERLELLSIFEVIPDPMQPRRAMPSAVRRLWDGNPANVYHLWGAWVDLAEAERGGAMELLNAILAHDGDPDHSTEAVEIPEEAGPVEAALLRVARMAADIRSVGQNTPAKAFRYGDGYMLEQGERRWLAMHLLDRYEGGNAYQRIQAQIVEQKSVWRQASENNVRENLNAIGRARQLAILLMDLLGNDGFKPFDACENEQDFYAQVADGEQYRVPRGKGEILVNAMGLKNARQLRDYRALLRLPSEVWQRADDENWPEKRIRELMGFMDTVPAGAVSPTPQTPAAAPTVVQEPSGAPEAAKNEGLSDNLNYHEPTNGTPRQLPLFSADERRTISRCWTQLKNADAGILPLTPQQKIEILEEEAGIIQAKIRQLRGQ